MELKDGVFSADCGIVDENITKILESTNKRELFLFDGQVSNDGAFFDDFKAKLGRNYKNLNWGSAADEGMT